MVGMHNQPAIGRTGVLNRAVLIPVGDTNRLVTFHGYLDEDQFLMIAIHIVVPLVLVRFEILRCPGDLGFQVVVAWWNAGYGEASVCIRCGVMEIFIDSVIR